MTAILTALVIIGLLAVLLLLVLGVVYATVDAYRVGDSRPVR